MVERELVMKGRNSSVKNRKHFWLPEPTRGEEVRLHDCSLRHLELKDKKELYGLSEEDIVIYQWRYCSNW